MKILKRMLDSIKVPKMAEEESNSDFSRERFENAINTSKVKLNQKIIDRQEREAKINKGSKPVAKVANDEQNLKKSTRSGGRYTTSKETAPDFSTWAKSRIANHNSKGSSYPHINFEEKTKNTLRKVSSNLQVSTTSTPTLQPQRSFPAIRKKKSTVMRLWTIAATITKVKILQ